MTKSSAAVRKVVYLGPADLTPLVENVLGPSFQVICVSNDGKELVNGLQDSVVWLDASLRVPLTGDLLRQAPKLELVAAASTGSDHIDHAALAARGIPVFTMRGQSAVLANLTPTAELAWLLLLACARRLRAAIRHTDQGNWNRDLFPGQMLRGRTLGIIGYGRLGRWMARYANAFEMRVQTHDPNVSEFLDSVAPVALEQLMSTSDYVSIHVPYGESTRHLISDRELALMTPGSILVNTSRGAVVDEGALVRALRLGRPSAVGVDVLDGEPDVVKSVLWEYAREHDNVLITPHIGGFSPDALEIVLRFTAGRVRDYFHAGSAS